MKLRENSGPYRVAHYASCATCGEPLRSDAMKREVCEGPTAYYLVTP